MLNKDQNQNVGNDSTAMQANRNIHVNNHNNYGMTYSEVKEIALDVAKATFYELTGVAKETAAIRVEAITDQIIKKLEQDYPAGLQKANDPDFQYALFTVQKEYARNGDKDLGDLLVELLVDRSKQDQRNILQIVLNESLATAPKLTESHLATLAVIFLFKYTQDQRIGNHQMLGAFLDEHLAPLIPKLSKNQSSYQHLEFAGCGSISLSGSSLEGIFGTQYQGLFLKGFNQSEIASRTISIGLYSQQYSRFFIPCPNDKSKLQVNANSTENLEQQLNANGISSEDRAKILELFDLGKMNESEIRDKLITIRPYMADLFEIWSNSPMNTFTLTSVGMAIGHANIKRFVRQFADLSIWIN